MPALHLLLILMVVLIWGVNFVFIKWGLDVMSPLTLCAFRFVLASIPAIFFIKPPAIPFRIVVSYGLIMFALQFTLMFMGMHLGMSPAMAAIILQVQVFFAMLFAAFFVDEMPYPWQILGALVSFSGIILIGTHVDKSFSLLGFLCILAASAAWGVGNLIIKKTRNVNTMSLVVWASFVASVPMLILALLSEGVAGIAYSYSHMTTLGFISLCYIVYASTWVGYSVWGWLLTKYRISTIVPFTLLVPVISVISSILILDEAFETWKIIAGLLVIGGLCINLLGSKFLLPKAVQV